MGSWHAAKGKGRCELQTKVVEYAANPLECYTFVDSVFQMIGWGACRTKLPTVNGPSNGTHYGHMKVEWVLSLDSCKTTCRNSLEPCVGVEFHPTPTAEGKNKCEVHFEELA